MYFLLTEDNFSEIFIVCDQNAFFGIRFFLGYFRHLIPGFLHKPRIRHNLDFVAIWQQQVLCIHLLEIACLSYPCT